MRHFERFLSPALMAAIATGVLTAEESAGEAPAAEATPSGDVWAADVGSTRVRLIDLSAITQVAVGATSGDGEELEWSQTGAHDPARDGFDFQALEISLVGAVDPYFQAEAHLLVTEDEGLELEEAFAVTTSLPHGLEVEVGLMLTEFGRYNPIHTHEYTHIDQPLVIGEMFGSEGTRDIGARVGWLVPVDWFSELHVSLQNGDNETAVSFLGEGHEHGEEEDEDEEHGSREIDSLSDMLWSVRWVNGLEISDDAEIQFGLSAAHGPNQLDDDTVLGGADVVFKWFNPNAAGGAGTLSWTTEFILRDVGASDAEEEATDWGLVSDISYDLTSQWRVGLRVDYVELEEHHDEDEDDDEEHTPAERLRVSPLVAYRPSEFTKLRLQYNYSDPSEGDEVHSVWLGLEVLIGSHPAHNF